MLAPAACQLPCPHPIFVNFNKISLASAFLAALAALCWLAQVALVAGIVAVAVFIGNLGEPIAENAIKSFPTPADYQAYEDSK
jgi:hypothetical protein